MNHKEAHQLLDEGGKQSAELTQHLQQCPSCQQYADLLAQLRAKGVSSFPRKTLSRAERQAIITQITPLVRIKPMNNDTSTRSSYLAPMMGLIAFSLFAIVAIFVAMRPRTAPLAPQEASQSAEITVRPTVAQSLESAQSQQSPATPIQFQAGETVYLGEWRDIAPQANHDYTLDLQEGDMLKSMRWDYSSNRIPLKGELFTLGGQLVNAGQPVPATATYIWRITNLGTASSNYRLNLEIPARVRFAPGATTQTFAGSFNSENPINYYYGSARIGQRISVSAEADCGLPIKVTETRGQEYVITHDTFFFFVEPTWEVERGCSPLYRITFTITDFVAPRAQPDEAIKFAIGETHYRSSDRDLPPHSQDSYLVELQKGQTLFFEANTTSSPYYSLTTMFTDLQGNLVDPALPLPATQPYRITVINSDSYAVLYRLIMEAPALVNFPLGSTTVTLPGAISFDEPHYVNRYVGQAQAGQRLQVTTENQCGLTIDLPVYSTSGVIGPSELDFILVEAHVGEESHSYFANGWFKLVARVGRHGNSQTCNEYTITFTITDP